MTQNEALKEDRKYIAILIGGSFLISLFTIIGGTLLGASDYSALAEVGFGVQVLGWMWVAGTFGIAMFIQARMRQLYGQTTAARVTE
jgi:hypothetical protein